VAPKRFRPGSGVDSFWPARCFRGFRSFCSTHPPSTSTRTTPGPILDALLNPEGGLFGPERTVVVATHQISADHVGVHVGVLGGGELKKGPLVLGTNGFRFPVFESAEP
jgi:hypothetical protein